jgi:hypothetical protein
LYEFVQKLVKKDLHPGWDFNPGPKWLAIVTPPPPLVPILFIYHTIRTPSEKVDYTISFVWHSQSLFNDWASGLHM